MNDQHPSASIPDQPLPPEEESSPPHHLPPKVASKIIKPLESAPHQSMPKKLILTLIAALLTTSAGIGTGFAASRVFVFKSASVTKTATEVASQGVQVGDVIGSTDESTFKDKAEGVLVKGGINGEGSHHLLRPGGTTQNVYLTSSALDLDQLVDHQVTVWGETFAAQKAGWLMDVGRAKVDELNAEKPFDESNDQ